MSAPRKVLHVLSGAGGGAALSVVDLVGVLRARGVESAIACHTGGSEMRAAICAAAPGEVLFTPLYWMNKKIRSAPWKRPIHEALQLASTGFAGLSALRVARFARAVGADLIHTSNVMNPEGALAARLLGLPHVWHIRELVGLTAPFPLPFTGPALGRFLLRNASLVVANSHASAAPLRALLPAESLRVVENGIDLGRFRPHLERPGPLVVAMVGSLSARSKKHRLFVEAVAEVTRELEVEFRIYGGAPVPGDAYARQVRELVAARGLGDRLSFRGFTPDPSALIAEIDVLVHPADNESFGRVVVEAMAAGIPVAGVAGGGVGEIVVDGVTGVLARPDDADGLAAGINRLVADAELRARMGAAGRARAVERYSLDRCAAGILSAYSDAMRRPLGWLGALT